MSHHSIPPRPGLWRRLRQGWQHRDGLEYLPEHIRADAGLPPRLPEQRLPVLLLLARS